MLLRSTTTKRKKALSKAVQTFLFAGEKDTACATTQTICSDDAATATQDNRGKTEQGPNPALEHHVSGSHFSVTDRLGATR